VAKKVENCENCAFGQDQYRRFAYLCRRHAPLAIMGYHGMRTMWPTVSATDFCGDFELKDAD
jgi:hypothetical protein